MDFLSRSGKFTVYDTFGLYDFSKLESSLRRFVPIDDRPSEEFSAGFVIFDDYMQPIQSMQKGVYYAASLRIDERKVPGSVFKKFFKVACEDEMRVKQIPKLSRTRKQEIKAGVKLSLLSKAFPQCSVTDVVFDGETGRIYLRSASSKVRDLFIELMEEAYPGASALQPMMIKSDEEDVNAKLLTLMFYKAMNNSLEGFAIGRSVSMTHQEKGTVAVVDPLYHHKEILSGLVEGKMVVKLGLVFSDETDEFPVVISDDLSISVKTPKLAEIEEGDEPEKGFYEKLFFVQKVVAEVEKNVKMFENELPQWGQVYGEILTWAEG